MSLEGPVPHGTLQNTHLLSSSVPAAAIVVPCLSTLVSDHGEALLRYHGDGIHSHVRTKKEDLVNGGTVLEHSDPSVKTTLIHALRSLWCLHAVDRLLTF